MSSNDYFKEQHKRMWEGIINELGKYVSFEDLVEKNKECFEEGCDELSYEFLQKLKSPFWDESEEDNVKCYACEEMKSRAIPQFPELINEIKSGHYSLGAYCMKFCPIYKSLNKSCYGEHDGVFHKFACSTDLEQIKEAAKQIRDAEWR